MNVIDPIVKLLGDNGKWLADITVFSIVIRLLISALFGGFIGIERAVKRRAAGLRTYILVSMGACVVMLTNQFVNMAFGTDASRLGAQVISGIGFLGAGTILVTSQNQIKGLTTAAGLWACACVGLACGIGFYTLSIIAFVIIMVAIFFLPNVERMFTKRSGVYEYYIEFGESTKVKDFIAFVRSCGVKIKQFESDSSYQGTGLYVCTVMLSVRKNTDDKYRNHQELLNEIKQLDYVRYAEEVL